jgi:hypothetical protein
VFISHQKAAAIATEDVGIDLVKEIGQVFQFIRSRLADQPLADKALARPMFLTYLIGAYER